MRTSLLSKRRGHSGSLLKLEKKRGRSKIGKGQGRPEKKGKKNFKSERKTIRVLSIK